MKNLLLVTTLLAATTAALSGCQSTPDKSNAANYLTQPVLKSSLMTTDGSNRDLGMIYLRPVQTGVQVYGRLTGLSAGKIVALHIHETGSCHEMGKAAGGHFNPADKPHGHPDTADSHAGDLPNMTADSQGVAHINYVNNKISVAMAGPNSVYRRAFIVHAGADDYTTQPSGGSGDRIACGIIEKN